MKRWMMLLLMMLMLLPPGTGMAEDAALFPAKGENGLWGYIDRTGAFAIPPQYAEISPWLGRWAAVSADGALWGIVDAEGNAALPQEYVIEWNAGGRALAVYRADSPDIRADWAVPLGAQVCGLFDLATGAFTGFRWKSAALPWVDTPLIPVLGDNHLWGYANLETGEQPIPCQFAEAHEFHEGWAVVQLPPVESDWAGWALVSEEGALVSPPEGLAIDPWSRVSQGLVTVRDLETDTAGYMDTQGRLAIPPRWNEAYPFSGNFGVVENYSGVWACRYVDREGNMVSGVSARPEENGGYEFVNGLTSVFVEDPAGGSSRPGAMNEAGEILFTLPGENVFWLWNFMENGLAWYMEWHPEAGEGWYEQQFYGLADSEGNLLTPSLFSCVDEEGSPFSEGLAPVYLKGAGKYSGGYLDEKGNWAIAPNYWYVGPFENGLAIVKTELNRCAYIDHEGEEVYAWTMQDDSHWWDTGLPE